jgi:hypothetical protein
METSTGNTATWFYEDGGQRKGPITEENIITLINAIKVTYGSLVWKAGFPEWLRAEDTELLPYLERVSPPPITGKHIGQSIVWTLAFAPIIGSILESIFAYAVNNSDAAADMAISDSRYWFITLALNIALAYYDEGRLNRAGYDTSKFKGAAWLVPVYLYRRAKALNQNLAYFIVWLVCFAVMLAA